MELPVRRPLSRPTTVDALIALVGEPICESIGPTDLEIDSVAPLSEGAKGTMVFCRKTGDTGGKTIARSAASVIVVEANTPVAARARQCVICTENPARWFIKAVELLFPSPDASIDASAVVEAGARIGDGCSIGPGTFIAACVTIGKHCVIGPNCTLGAPGLAIERERDGTPVRYPHLGNIVIGDGVSIGAGSVIVRGILEDTRIGAGTQIGNMVNIGHNCVLGANCWISTGAILCGSVKLGNEAMIGAGATVNNHASIGNGAVVGIGSVVTKSVADGKRVFGVPARTIPTMRSL